MDLTASDNRPPCWEARKPCPNQCAAQVFDQVTRNHVRLHGPWAGWRLVGREMVSPEGVRVSPERMKGLMWRQEAEARLTAIRARNSNSGHRGVVTVLRIRNSDWHAERFGSVAG